MKGQQPVGAAAKKTADGDSPMEEMWAAAAQAFESICGESLRKGDVKSFDDVQEKIENSGQMDFGIDAGPEDNWEKAKSVGLESLKYLKMLVGAASQASSFIPIPEAAASITSNALCFVFDIPQAIKGYNDAIDQVFSEVSSALSQFQIYRSMENVDPLLIKQIHLVLGRKLHRFMKQFKSVFDDDSGLTDEMAEFKRALQGQRDVEGTVTLAVVSESRQDIAMLLEEFIVFGKNTEQTQQVVQETHKGVQALKDDSDRTKTLVKIRDILGVPSTVRLDTNTTQTCTNISDRCLDGTGSWIWTHDAYLAWTAPKDKLSSHVLIVSGPQSSGKTSTSALITKRLEEQKGRTYVGHYFFPANTKKSDEDKNPVQSALKYIAFQIARVDATVQNALSKACDGGPAAFRRSASPENLDILWGDLKIGVPGSGATYYLVFDGLENLPNKHTEMLLGFIFGSRLGGEVSGRVRVLVSGTDEQLSRWLAVDAALRIQMEKQNGPDMRIVIDETLNKQGMLQNVKTNSEQQKARNKIVEKLPQNVNGSYSLLQFGLGSVIRLLSTRTAIQELDRMLDQSMSSHEAAIKNLQRSLTTDEISELNELLKWVLFGNYSLTLDQLEAAMLLYSGISSLTSLEYIIKNKYSAVLKIEDGYVYAQDGVQEYLEKKKDSAARSSLSKDRATISMSITINNVDQELCGHFLWDLADMAIRDKFKFSFSGENSNPLHSSSSQGAIAADEFEANHTIITRAFEYLNNEPNDQSKEIGEYLVCWLPYHLGRLRQLEDEDKGALMPHEQLHIGQNLYKLFKDEIVFKRHKKTFEQIYWTLEEMRDVQKWLMDSAVVRKLDKKWRAKVQFAITPTRGYLKELVILIARSFLRERSWSVSNARRWLQEFMAMEDSKPAQSSIPSDAKLDDANSVASSSSSSSIASISDVNWDKLSMWCRDILELADQDLDSIWYERLAEASGLTGSDPEVTVSLYERAIKLKDPSWLCHRGLGTTHYNQGRTADAIAQLTMALKEVEQKDAVPKPEAKDIVELHLLLGDYTYAEGDMSSAMEHYSFACKSDNADQATQGQLGHLKAKLGSPDAENMRHTLKTMLIDEGGKERMVNVLKMVARDFDHDAVVSKMLALAKEDSDLLQGIIDAMQAATGKYSAIEDRTTEPLEVADRFAADEARGVLLYDLGLAIYTYHVSLDGVEPINEAIRLWAESRDQLISIGGPNASIARSNATSALANHYFQSMMDGLHLDNIDALARLAKDDSDVYHNDPVGFLGALHALRGDKEQARAVLIRQVRQALQILSDDMPENDTIGFSIIHKALEHYQDFKNAAVALSLLGQPDLVTDALYFEIGDIPEDYGEDKQQLLGLITKIAKETTLFAKKQVPDISKQLERIQVAKTYVDSLVIAAQASIKPVTDSDVDIEARKPEAVNSITGTAHRLIQSRLSDLEQSHTPELNLAVFQWSWSCDGRTTDGKRCQNVADFHREFYHCIYCSNRDFCGDCLARLREGHEVITVCSSKHRWLRIPPQGEDIYIGRRAKTVRIPSYVQAAEGNEQILMAHYAENGDQEVTIETWKERVAEEWGISLKEIKASVSRMTTPE